MRTLGRVIVVCWCLILLGLFVSPLFPSVLTWVPHPERIRVVLPVFLLLSIIYGVYNLYRLGMKRARRK